jgi:cell division septation protein DedD
MDPLGRYLVVRPESGDSAWVVSLSDERLVATVQTIWRDDLPAVALDGSLVTLIDNNVLFVDPRTNKTSRAVNGGGFDLWFFVRWNGFRPRARGIDEPVSFAYERSVAPVVAIDSATGLPRVPVDSTRPPATIEPPPAVAEPITPRSRGWTVSFAAVLSLERAREIAATISVDGSRPRVVTGETAGTTVYRVVLGPYDSREAAERIGRSSKHSYWIYEAVP